MYPELQALIHQAEYSYLQSENLESLSAHVTGLQAKLKVYKLIRDKEIDIFQPVADKLLEKMSGVAQKDLETSLQHWLLIMRYASMAMLLNNPEFLERRLLEWLTDIVTVRQSREIDQAVYDSLLAQLAKVLPAPSGLEYIKPFLSQAKNYLINDQVTV
ncbi:MAG: phycobilisome protein [Cyanobacterium sp. T60_A2020_053]|nr:phycobilisome protein [Cyanobacterium sp. T60_A2020_053]